MLGVVLCSSLLATKAHHPSLNMICWSLDRYGWVFGIFFLHILLSARYKFHVWWLIYQSSLILLIVMAHAEKLKTFQRDYSCLDCIKPLFDIWYVWHSLASACILSAYLLWESVWLVPNGLGWKSQITHSNYCNDHVFPLGGFVVDSFLGIRT